MLASDISFGEGRPVCRVRREHQCGRALAGHAGAEEECLACTIEWDLSRDATSLASVRRHKLTPGKRTRWRFSVK